MSTKYRTLATILRLRAFTIESLANATGIGAATLHTQIGRISHLLNSDPIPGDGPGRRPNLYRLTPDGEQLLRRELQAALGDSGEPWAWEHDEDVKEAGLLQLPPALLAAELELLDLPTPVMGSSSEQQRHLARARALLDAAAPEIGGLEEPLAARVGERFEAASTLCDVIASESQELSTRSAEVARHARRILSSSPQDPELIDIRKRIAASPLFGEQSEAEDDSQRQERIFASPRESRAPFLEYLKGVRIFDFGSAKTEWAVGFTSGVVASLGISCEVHQQAPKGDPRTWLRGIVGAIDPHECVVMIYHDRWRRHAAHFVDAVEQVAEDAAVILVDPSGGQVERAYRSQRLEFVELERGGLVAAEALTTALGNAICRSPRAARRDLEMTVP